MTNIHDLLSKPVSAVLGCLLILIFLLLVLPAQSRSAREYTPEDASFDTSFYTPASEVYLKAAAYSEDGRARYIKARWTFDLIFPLSYTFFCMTAMSFSARVLFRKKLKWLLLIPLAALAFDIAENSFVTAAMYTLAHPRPVLAWGVSISTLIKWIFVSLSFSSAVLGLLSTGVLKLIRLNSSHNRT